MQNMRSLKKLISERFTKETKKIFYSFEVTPKWNYEIEMPKLTRHPLFIGIAWIGDQNLKGDVSMSPAFQLRGKIEKEGVNAVNTLTCYRLEDKHVDEILSEKNGVRNLTILRGDTSDTSQKFKYANQLIEEIRRKTQIQDDITIFAAAYPNTHPEAGNVEDDLKILKQKVDCGVDCLLTQLIFSSDNFCKFVKNCRDHGINVPILPGFYIPSNRHELEFILKISKASIPQGLQQKFQEAQDEEKFQNIGLQYTCDVIKEIQEKSPEHIPGFHFFTMNNMTMVNKLTQIINFSDAS